MKNIGERIKELRLQHDMTLKELGEAIDFNYSNLSKIERGNRKPAIEVLESLSNYFNINISYFFTGEKKVHNVESPYETQLIQLTEEMIEKNVSIEELREIIQMLKGMKGSQMSVNQLSK